MTRFTLKDALVGLTIASIGLGMIAYAFQMSMPRLSWWEMVQLGLAGGGSWIAGQGVAYPLIKSNRRMWPIGMVICFVIVVVVLRLMANQKAIP